MRRFASICVGLAAMGLASAQEMQPPKPGPEHAMLKKQEGVWECTVKMAGQESKARSTMRMGLGGLWLMSDFNGEMMGQRFQGRGMDTYDPATKKFKAIWADSWSTSPLVMEGTFDEATKTMTMTGMGMGQDGKPAKHKTTSKMNGPDSITFKMYMVTDSGETEMLQIEYKKTGELPAPKGKRGKKNEDKAPAPAVASLAKP